MISRLGTCAVTMQVKIWTLKRLANSKGWVWSLSLPPQVLPNGMAEANRSLLPSCSMAQNFLPFYEMVYGLKPPTLPCFSKIIPNRDLSEFQQFWEGKEKHPCFSTKNW